MLRVLGKRPGLIRFVSCGKGRGIHYSAQLKMASEKLAVSQCMHISADWRMPLPCFCGAASKEGHRAREKLVVSDAYTPSSIEWCLDILHRVEFVALAMETKAVNLGQVPPCGLPYISQLAVNGACYRACLTLLLPNTCWMLCQSAVERPRATSTPEARLVGGAVCVVNISDLQTAYRGIPDW